MTPLPLVSIHRRLPADARVASDRVPLKKRLTPTPDDPLIVSVSEIRDFVRCRARWAFRHRLRLEPKQGSENLSIGALTHSISDAWYQEPSPKKRTPALMAKIAKAQIKQTTLKALDTSAKELVGAMTIGFAHWINDPTNEYSDSAIGYVHGFPESWFEFPLADDNSIRLRGKYDNRFVSKTLKRTMGLFEMKTAKSIQMSKFDTSPQVIGYIAAMRHDFRDQGFRRFVAYPTVLRKQLPGPRVKADLFARVLIEPTNEELDQYIIDTRRIALDMLDAAIYPTQTDSCNWDCDFRNPCLLRGTTDLRHVLKTEYQPKEYRV